MATTKKTNGQVKGAKNAPKANTKKAAAFNPELVEETGLQVETATTVTPETEIPAVTSETVAPAGTPETEIKEPVKPVKGLELTSEDYEHNPEKVCEVLTALTAAGRLKIRERNIVCPAAPVTAEIMTCDRAWYVKAKGTNKRLAYVLVIGYTEKKGKPITQSYWYDVLKTYLEVLPETVVAE